jgi:AcrR family transcriptional regulator
MVVGENGMSPKIVDKDEKRRQIAFAAIKLFSENGFERSRIDDVAKEAGVGKGTIYEYFKDKDALIKGAFEVLMSDVFDDMMEIDFTKPSLESLRDLSLSTVRAMNELGNTYIFFVEYLLYSARAGEYHFLDEMLKGYRGYIATILKEGVKRGEVRPEIDVKKTAAAFAAWFDGAVFHWMISPDTVSFEEMTDSFLEMSIRGLAFEQKGTEK